MHLVLKAAGFVGAIAVAVLLRLATNSGAIATKRRKLR